MPDNKSIEAAKNVIQSHPNLFSKIFAAIVFIFGVLVVIGAVKNWDWLYAPDKSYHSWWNLSQVSRYMGRNTARILGAVGGSIIILAGGAWCYAVFLKK